MEGRVSEVNKIKPAGNVVYIMARDQRLYENHCVTLGYKISYENKSEFFLGIELNQIKMNIRQKQFILEGLVELQEECYKYNVSLSNIDNLADYIESNSIKTLILDFNPMKEYIERVKEIEKICKENSISLLVCDSHNVVPCKNLKIYKRTPKAVRVDLYKEWDKYLKPYESIEVHKYNKPIEKNFEFEELLKKNKVEESPYYKGGYSEGMKKFNIFLKEKFSNYAEKRNNPDINALSELSPYFHSGHISPLNITLMTINKHGPSNSQNYLTFINEMFIWRETSEHFVYHEKNYDNIEGALAWAKDTLLYHAQDERNVKYTKEQLEEAKTNDNLWNAAQNELLKTGKIHGYVRMYWAKRLLTWFEDPREALRVGIELNDEYAIDGNDPNGYLGVMWSICGSLDRAFGERPIYGKIRPMKSFKAPEYILKWGKGNGSSFFRKV